MHWTYRRAPKRSDLEQGDILLPTPELRTVFREVHRHFDDPKYLGFVVTSQTCDLVRRGKSKACETPYISVAVIRPLNQVILDLIDQVCSPIGPGIYRDSERARAKELLYRVFNQNEWKLGIFYLHPDADLTVRGEEVGPSGFGDNAVCLLRVSVALRRVHYKVLCAARCGRLKPEFSNKLGWMVGNLYSRVATPDWSEHPGGGAQIDELVSDFVGSSEARTARPLWLTDDQVAALQASGVQIERMTKEDIIKKLESLKVETSLDRAVREVSSEIGRVLTDVAPERLETICNRLRNNGKFRKAIRG